MISTSLTEHLTEADVVGTMAGLFTKLSQAVYTGRRGEQSSPRIEPERRPRAFL